MQNSNQESVCQAVRNTGGRYVDRGYMPIPLLLGQKRPPKERGWQHIRISTQDHLNTHFSIHQAVNIGLLTGSPSNNLVDVDCDLPEAVAIAGAFLPKTGMIHGRPGKPRSHFWYQAGNAGESRKFEFTHGSETICIVELRSTGQQTMVPPSKHPSGEELLWHEFGEPGAVAYDGLLAAVGRLAAAALLARFWPGEGVRQDAALALAGGLLLNGFSEEEAEVFVEAVARAAKDDEAPMRVGTVRSSADKIGGAEPVKGFPALTGLVGNDVVATVMKWLGIQPKKNTTPSNGKGRELSQAEKLVELVLGRAELFATPDGVGYATVQGNIRKETFGICSTDFRRWLAGAAQEAGFIPCSNARSDASTVIEAQAHNCGVIRQVHHRLARVGEVLSLDLANRDGQVVEVTADGWKILSESPVPFVRHKNMAPLPKPVAGSSLEELRKFVNIENEDWPLLRGWLLDCYKGDGPYSILLINGEQGSAKSTATKMLRAVLDPVHKAGVSRLQRDEWELAISASRSLGLFFDNVSTLPQWLSDALAAMATGTGLRVRQHYSMDDEVVFGLARPICFNGIPDFAESADLLDRSMRVTLPPIPDNSRKDEDQLWPGFHERLPFILGGLLDDLSRGLRNYANTRLEKAPRMARTARWVTACESGMAEQGQFLRAYQANRDDLNAQAVEQNLVATCLLRWLTRAGYQAGQMWTGTAYDLWGHLREQLSDEIIRQSDFPRAANKLGSQLRRIVPLVRQLGVEITYTRTNSKRLLFITLTDRWAVPENVTPVAKGEFVNRLRDQSFFRTTPAAR